MAPHRPLTVLRRPVVAVLVAALALVLFPQHSAYSNAVGIICPVQPARRVAGCGETLELILNVNSVTTHSIEIAWTMFAPTGTSEYQVYRDGTFIQSVSIGTFSYNDTGLALGTTYSYVVQAFNDGGQPVRRVIAVGGSMSSNSVTQQTAYNPALNSSSLALSPSSSWSISMSWSSIVVDSGDTFSLTPDMTYTVAYAPSTNPAQLLAFSLKNESCVLTNLQPATAYQVVLTVANGLGGTTTLSSTAMTMDEVALSAPLRVGSNTPTFSMLEQTRVLVSWGNVFAPQQPNSFPVTYVLTRTSGATTAQMTLNATTDSAFYATGLSLYTSYTFSVTATQNGLTSVSASAVVMTPAGTPVLAGATSSTRYVKGVLFTWPNPGVTPNGPTVSPATMQVSTNFGTSWTNVTTNALNLTTTTYTTLSCMRRYVNAANFVSLAQTVSAYPYSWEPTFDSLFWSSLASRGSTWLNFTWSAATPNGPGPVKYRVVQLPSTTVVDYTSPLSSTWYNVTGLTPYTSYTFTVTARNQNSNESAVQTTAALTTLPDVPVWIGAPTTAPTATAQSLSFAWSGLLNWRGPPGSYNWVISPAPFYGSSTGSTLQPSLTVPYLEPYTQYTLTLNATQSAVSGRRATAAPFTSIPYIFQATTLAGEPGWDANGILVSAGSTVISTRYVAVTLTWTNAVEAGTPLFTCNLTATPAYNMSTIPILSDSTVTTATMLFHMNTTVTFTLSVTNQVGKSATTVVLFFTPDLSGSLSLSKKHAATSASLREQTNTFASSASSKSSAVATSTHATGRPGVGTSPSTGSGGIPLAAIAGAIAGIVVLAIVIAILVVRRRRRRQPNARRGQAKGSVAELLPMHDSALVAIRAPAAGARKEPTSTTAQQQAHDHDHYHVYAQNNDSHHNEEVYAAPGPSTNSNRPRESVVYEGTGSVYYSQADKAGNKTSRNNPRDSSVYTTTSPEYAQMDGSSTMYETANPIYSSADLLPGARPAISTAAYKQTSGARHRDSNIYATTSTPALSGPDGGADEEYREIEGTRGEYYYGNANARIYGTASTTAKTIRGALKLGRTLGSGAFGMVHLGTLAASGLPRDSEHLIPAGQTSLQVAVKLLQEDADEKSRRDFDSEAAMMSQFSHPNIVLAIAALVEETPHMLLLEFLPYGDLRELMIKSKSALIAWKLPEFSHVLAQIASGMVYLESVRFVHRDLAARNCLVGPDLTVKISDFGLSRVLEEDSDYYRVQTKGRLPVKWMSIESLVFRTFTTQSDVWAFGIVAWEVFSYGNTPYPQIAPIDMAVHLENGGRLGCPDSCPPDLFQTVAQCWDFDPANRPRFQDLADTFAALVGSDVRDIGARLAQK
ncbi:proto-oncogene tyrosine-protein kinase FER [Capsaspora owczarzaki ATCC 30864]|uniref:receptor protein-tyrosine kinase n=1 Tax=Capsaspora owczarzaki (strain ATCC 30864) TaxID=595528 RepID=A0A0D2WKW2_CAPO3|nr:proto-oncogene tyrosine-protein kinase FER [Capsaspora owczarzaki ATCC 30864]KJE90353.1 TKL protein kinase [Capsaspora owczarzaki ATCC 30864]|eukprot:XP_004364544.1 proto-oncogene tyrosine-protein kinase FER [Capsaspora owczarzaki ATCC 30864]